MKALILAVALVAVASTGCGGKVPPNLTPQATSAWYGTQAIHGLDILRDTAISAADNHVIVDATARKVVLWHESAIKVIHALPGGWKPTVLAGLDELMKDVPAADQQTLAPYVRLAKAAIQEVK